MLWKIQRLFASLTGPTGRDDSEKEPLTAAYVASLTGLLVSRKIGLSTWVWAVRARPASVCGRGGSYGLASWM
jgi:CHASE1-domain containing sensor protein